MTRPSPAGRVLALALAVLLALAASASANTQGYNEPDETVTETGGKELDLQSVTISQNETEALFEAAVQYPSSGAPPHDQVQVFLDTNGDGGADRAVGFVGLATGQYTVEVREVTQTPANCQRLGAALFTSPPVTLPAADGAGRRELAGGFPASHLGASSYKVAAYVVNDSLSRAAFDYLPNEANPLPARSNPVSDDMDGCETDGDNDFDDGVDTAGSDRAFPVDMTKAVQYGTATSPGAATPSTGGGTPPPPANNTRSVFGSPVGIQIVQTAVPKMPQLQPKDSKSTKFTQLASAEFRLRGLGVPVDLRLRPLKSNIADSTKQAKYLREKGQGLEIMDQSPAPGTPLVPKNGKPPIVKLGYYDAADDIADRNRKCELTDTGTAKKALRGKTPSEAAFELRRLDCTARYIDGKAFGIQQPEVVAARKLGNGSIEVTIGKPQNAQDLILVVREDPTSAKAGDTSFTQDFRLPRAARDRKGKALNRSRFKVQVLERSTGRFVPNALVVVTDGDTSVFSDLADSTGEAEFAIAFGKVGKRTLYAEYNGANGVSASGWRELYVADLKGRAFTSSAGRQFTSKGGKYSATAASSLVASRMRIAPASLGSGATGTEVVAPDIVRTKALALHRNPNGPNGVAPIVADHNAVDIRGTGQGSSLVCAGRGSILYAAGLKTAVNGNPVQDCGSALLGLLRAHADDLANVRSEVGDAKADFESSAAAAAEQGAQAPPGNPEFPALGLTTVAGGHGIPFKKGDVQAPGQVLSGIAGSGFIGTNTGGLITDAGGSLKPPTSLISDKGLGLISDKGLGLIGDHGTGLRQSVVGLTPNGVAGAMPAYAAPLIGQAGGN